MEKSKRITGYHLHIARSLYSTKTIIRSIKFPLKSPSHDAGILFAENIRNDYLKQVGNIHPSAYFASTIEYSLLDLYVEFLRQGFLFAPTATKLKSKVYKITYGKSLAEVDIFPNISQEFLNLVSKDLFDKTILQNSTVRNTSTKASLDKRYTSIFKKEVLRETVLEQVTKMVDGVYRKNYEEQKQFWKNFINLEFSEKESNLTCYPLPNKGDKFSGKTPIQEIILSHFESKKKDLFGTQRQDLTDEELKLARIELLEDIGLSANFNALSNFLGSIVPLLLTEKGIRELISKILNYSTVWKDKEEILEGKIAILALTARKISLPSLTASWADYRSSFGGKIQSWVSNFLTQNVKLREALNEQNKEIQELKKEYTIDSSRVIEINRQLLGNLTNQSQYQLYVDSLAYLNTEINMLRQERDVDFKLFQDKYKALSSNLPKIPNFIVQRKFTLFQDFQNSLVKLEQGFSYIHSVYNELLGDIRVSQNPDIDGVLVRKTLDSLKRFYCYLEEGSYYKNVFKEFFLSIGHTVSEIEGTDKRFFIAPQSRDKQLSLIIVSESTFEIIKDKLLKIPIDFSWKHQSISELLAITEVMKIITAFYLKMIPNTKEFTLDENTILHFPAGQRYLKTLGKSLNIKHFSFFLQRYIFAELRGCLNLLSRETYIERYVVQTLGSDKSFPLVLFPKDKEQKPSITNRAYWGIVSQRPSRNQKDQDDTLNGYIFKSKEYNQGAGSFKENTKIFPNEAVFQIRSSKYQLQFLDNPLNDLGDRSLWKRVSVKLSEHSFIVEDTMRVTWDREKMRPNISCIKTDIYVSIPINISPNIKPHAVNPSRYMGIDVGEYGLAYTIFETNPKFKILKQGFLYNANLRKIKSHIKRGKEKQVRGTFSSPSTSIQLIREQAITSIRNTVHDLVIRYKAKPVYEWQISNFETGSGKISKIYNSIKTSDTNSDTDAEKGAKELVWGKGTKTIGKEINAYATSTICSKCFKSYLLEIGLKDSDKFTLEKIGNETFIKINNTLIRYFSRKPITNTDDAKSAIYGTMRPPQYSEIVKSLDIEDRFFSTRGNSAIFYCPFCKHISDADIQASLFIGLKGYLKDLEKKTETTKNNTQVDRKTKSLDETRRMIKEARLLVKDPILFDRNNFLSFGEHLVNT